jgi:uncharacterized ion transporter superfamily protein YfcC
MFFISRRFQCIISKLCLILELLIFLLLLLLLLSSSTAAVVVIVWAPLADHQIITSGIPLVSLFAY